MKWLRDIRYRFSYYLLQHADIMVITGAVIFFLFMMYQTYISVERMFEVLKI
ncbi:hypothetical protein GQ472_06125 [archaeon]|nr:hypothetical protein [archaeon]